MLHAGVAALPIAPWVDLRELVLTDDSDAMLSEGFKTCGLSSVLGAL